MQINDYYAQINWADNTPHSKTYQDIYFNLAGGLEESSYVFLKHNDLANKFNQLNQNTFSILELGFGCGLNFLNTIKLWQGINPLGKLEFISVEKKPLSPEDLKSILANFPSLKSQASELIKQYYLLLPGTHYFYLSPQVSLILIIGEASVSLKKLNTLIDSFFLDGFSPTKNPEIWSLEVFSELNRLSKKNASFATFSASSYVRKNLQAAGFQVVKAKGFNLKREMLFGFLIEKIKPVIPTRPQNYYAKYLNANNDEPIIVIGAGISGASSAYALARRGFKVLVIEKNSDPAKEASGNQIGILYVNLDLNYTLNQELSFNAYRYSHNLITTQLNLNKNYLASGVLELIDTPQELSKYQKLANQLDPEFLQFLTPNQVQQKIVSLITKDYYGAYFPSGLSLNPPSIVKSLLDHPNISVLYNTKIEQIDYINHAWELKDQHDKTYYCHNLVLANSYAAKAFKPTLNLDLKIIRGQVSHINAVSPITTALCAKGYLTPSINNQYLIGATFNFKDLDPSLKIKDHQENISYFKDLLPDLNLASLDLTQLTGKTGFRATTYDYLPLVGPLATSEDFYHTFNKLRQDKKAWINKSCNYYPGLYLNLAHGTKGMLTAPYCGEIIAAYINNGTIPCSEALRIALHPNRLLVRNLVKGLLTT